MKHALGKKYNFLYLKLWIQVQTLLLTIKFLAFRWPFYQLILFTFKVTFQQRYHSHFHSPLTFLWLRVQEVLAKDLLDWCWEERKRKNPHIADVSFLLVVPITLKNWHCQKQISDVLLFLSARVNVFAQLESEYCFKEANWKWMMKQWINSQEYFAFSPSITAV